MWPFKPKESAIVELDYKPKLLTEDVSIITEKFKGEIEKRDVKFPAELGEEHPFNFKTLEKLYEKFGFFTAVVDKYVDFVWGSGFYVTSDDERAQQIIEDFMRDVNFDTLGRAWTKEALVKGNGFLEIGGNKRGAIDGLKVLNANYMYAERDKLGVVKGYNQYKGEFDRFAKEKVIPFKPHEIAHVPFNIVGDCAYGIGIGYPALVDINSTIQNEKSNQVFLDRKAHSKLHAKLGKVDGNVKIIPKPEDVTAFGKEMENMDNKTNWATDPLVELSVVDFGTAGDRFNKTLEYDINKLLYVFQIPGVLMGMARIPEGLARFQMEAFQKRIQAIQTEFEKIIEQQIFRRVLNANGFVKDSKGTEVHVEFEWGTPSVMEVEGRLKVISELVKSPATSIELKNILQDELVNILKLDEDIWEQAKTDAEEERKREEERPQPIVPGQNAKFPKPIQPKSKQPVQPKPQVTQSFEPQRVQVDVNVNKNEEVLPVDFSQLNSDIKSMNDAYLESLKILINNSNKKFDEVINKIPIPKEISKEDIMNEVKKELEKIKIKKKESIPKKGNIKSKLKGRVSLLRPFRITRKTESTKTEEPKKLVVKVKRTKENENYEYGKECKHCSESWDKINDIEEWLGFNYKEYLGHILKVLGEYKFNQLLAINEIELEAGMLTETQINSLRNVLEDGFKKGKSINDMVKGVNKKVRLKDLYRMTAEGDIKKGASGLPILARSADKRAVSIVRSEITRTANAGAVEYYKENDIKQVSWVASFGDRTCPECESLDGQIFEVNNHPDIPLHVMCRCTLSPVVELK